MFVLAKKKKFFSHLFSAFIFKVKRFYRVIIISFPVAGTNFPPELYDGHLFGKESYYDELAKVQKAEMDRREKASFLTWQPLSCTLVNSVSES